MHCACLGLSCPGGRKRGIATNFTALPEWEVPCSAEAYQAVSHDMQCVGRSRGERTSPTFSYRNFSGVKDTPLPRNARRASSTHDMGALCFSIANVGSTDSMARGTGSLSSTKLLTAPGGRLSNCAARKAFCSACFALVCQMWAAWVSGVHISLCCICHLSRQRARCSSS